MQKIFILIFMVLLLFCGVNSVYSQSNPIVFSSNRSGNYEIYTMRADGSHLIRLTNHSGDDIQPAWTPDGKRIIFSSNRYDDYDIYSMKADGTNTTLLTWNSADDKGPAVNPRTGSIAFYTYRDDNWEVYVMNQDGTGKHNITNSPSAAELYPFWSPNGNFLVHETQIDSGTMEIFRRQPNGANPVNLTNHSSGDYYPSISPDGRYVSFESDRTGSWRIHLMSPDGSNQRLLPNAPPQPDWSNRVGWSPDSKTVLFPQSHDLYSMRLNGTKLTNLTQAAGTDCQPNWFLQSKNKFPWNLFTMVRNVSPTIVKVISSNEGGSVSIPSGAALHVVPGTVPENESGHSAQVTFSVKSPVVAPAPLGNGGKFLGNLVQYGPEGFIFRWPVKMTLPFPAGIDPITITVVFYDEESGSWKRIMSSGIDVANRLLTFDALKLGIYGLATFPAFSSSQVAFDTDGDDSLAIQALSSDDCDGGLIFKIYGDPGYDYAITILNVTNFRFPYQAVWRRGLIGQMATPGPGRNYIGYIASEMHLPQATYTMCLTRMKNGQRESYSIPIPVVIRGCLSGAELYNISAYHSLYLSDFKGGNWRRGGGCNWPPPTVTNGTGQFEARLTWVNNSSHSTDLDLILYGPGGMKVYYQSKTSADGSMQLDRDWQQEFGSAVENIYSVKNMLPGSYRLVIDHYNGDGVNYTIRVIAPGKNLTRRQFMNAGASNRTVFSFTKR